MFGMTNLVTWVRGDGTRRANLRGYADGIEGLGCHPHPRLTFDEQDAYEDGWHDGMRNLRGDYVGLTWGGGWTRDMARLDALRQRDEAEAKR
jgi:ribosome modulation factor